MIQSRSQIATIAYHDLRRLAQDEAIATIIGNPHKLMRNCRAYWYDMYRLGTAVKNRHLGQETPDMLDRITRHRVLAAQSKQRRAERNRLVRLFRAEGHTSTDRLARPHCPKPEMDAGYGGATRRSLKAKHQKKKAASLDAAYPCERRAPPTSRPAPRWPFAVCPWTRSFRQPWPDPRCGRPPCPRISARAAAAAFADFSG